MHAERFLEHLKGRGIKLTRERELILREIASTDGHFEPEGLLIKLRGKNIDVSRASIYRTIPLLLECGLIAQAVSTDRRTIYEVSAGGHHDHMICSRCGRVIEFLSEDLERLQDEICRTHGFSPASHALEIRGRCRQCAADTTSADDRK